MTQDFAPTALGELLERINRTNQERIEVEQRRRDTEQRRRDALIPEERQAEDDDKRRQAQAAVSRAVAEVTPRRYWGARELEPPTKLWAETHLQDRFSDGLLLAGPTGVGKTYQMFAIARLLIERQFPNQRRIAYWDTSHLLTVLRPDSGVPYADTFTSLTRAPLVMFDDVGAHKASEWTEQALFSIINARYLERMPTIVATNLTSAQLTASLGERLTSRLAEASIRVVLKGNDRRRS